MDNVQHTSYTPIPTQGFTDHETVLTSEHLQTLESGVIKNDGELEDVIRETNSTTSSLGYYFNNLVGLHYVDYGSSNNDVITTTETDVIHIQSRRSGFRYYVNGSYDAENKYYYLKLSNTYQEKKGSNIKNFTEPIVLTDQHVYYWMVRLIGGSASRIESADSAFEACITKDGTSRYLDTISTDGNTSISYVIYRESSYPTGLHFTIRLNPSRGITFDNAIFECMLFDLTHYGDINIAQPETPYSSNEHVAGDYMFDAGQLRRATENFAAGDYVYSHQVATTVGAELKTINESVHTLETVATPTLPTEAGTYVLKVTVVNNEPTYSWQVIT